MKETVNRIVEKEGPNGLIIIKAIYGKIIDKNKWIIKKKNFFLFIYLKFIFISPNFESEKILDIRIPLQFLVSDHNLQILSDQSKVIYLNFR